MSDLSYLDEFLPTFTVLGVDTSEYDKYDATIRRMLKVVASLPPARRAVFAAQVAAISEKFKAIDGSITSDDDKLLWTRHLRPLAVQATKIIVAAKESPYQATVPGYAAQPPTAEDRAWAALPENSPSYVPPADMAAPPDMTSPDMAQAHADAGSTFLTRNEPPKAETPWPWWVWPIATVAAVAVTGYAWRMITSASRAKRNHLPPPISAHITGTAIKIAPEDLIIGSDDKTRVPWKHLPLVPEEPTAASRRRNSYFGEHTPTRADSIVEVSSLFDNDDKTPIDRPKKKK